MDASSSVPLPTDGEAIQLPADCLPALPGPATVPSLSRQSTAASCVVLCADQIALIIGPSRTRLADCLQENIVLNYHLVQLVVGRWSRTEWVEGNGYPTTHS